MNVTRPARVMVLSELFPTWFNICRERASSTYAPGPYSLAAGIVEIPYLIVQTVSQR